MMLLLLTLGAGVVAGCVVALLATRWPVIEAPRLSGDMITEEVARHPGLAGHLRHHFNPRTETGIALIIATAVIGTGAVGIGILLAMVRNEFGLQSVDVRLARFGAENATDASTAGMRLISELGGTRGVIAIAIVGCVVEYRRLPTRASVLFLALVVGGQFALSNGIKYVVERARPDINPLTGFAGSSFPSGHATAAAATLAAIALLATRRRSNRAKLLGAAVAAGGAVMVAATRVFLGVHWFTDVIAGLLLGWAWFAICSIAFGGRLLSFGLPIVVAEAVADVVPTPAEAARSHLHSDVPPRSDLEF